MFADDAASLLDHLGVEQAIVCGHSMGGRVAQLLSLDYPKKVKKLILAATGASMPERGIPLKLCKNMVERGYEKYVRDFAIIGGFTKRFVEKYPDRVEKFLSARTKYLAPLECYLRHVIARMEHDTSGRLTDIQIPTLILVGEEDDFGSTELTHRFSAEILKQGIPHAKLVVLPNEKHGYFFANPEVAVHKVIRDFLEEN